MTQTKRHGAEVVSPRASREIAVATARRWIIDGRRIDMGALASEVGAGRATLHRWFGTREGLIGDVLWSLTERTIDDLELEADGRGADRIAFVVGGLGERFLGSEAIRAFVAAEPAALGILASPESQIMERFAARLQRLLEVEVRLGALPRELDPEDVANLIVRVSSAIVFADLVTEREPDVVTIDRAVRAFLA